MYCDSTGELRHAGSSQISQLRNHARRSPEDASIEERSEKWTAYALALSKADQTISWEAEWQCSGEAMAITSLHDELTLVLVVLAASWRQTGRYYASDILLQEAEQQTPLTKKAISAFRQSAAIAQYTAEHHLSSEQPFDTARNPLLHKATARCLAALAHAEQQALLAHLACLGNKGNVLGSLHVGASGLFLSADQELRAAAWESQAELLAPYVKLSAALQLSRAHLSTAFKLEDEGEPAKAWGHALEAVKIFTEAEPLWKMHKEWEEAVAAEKVAFDAAVLHFKSSTAQFAYSNVPARPEDLSLPAGKSQPIAEFQLA
ncbi:hypothetical protein WJX73_006955 [Symbiochloris irregularis]|uniref:BRO1 domain-containing protein n=1 Tax=Symbiochloris irregularis TaxID=706552 RepID=A0AAW1NJ78_9CHLO